jgi:hypothetical protein
MSHDGDHRERLWQAAEALPALDAAGSLPPFVALRRVYESWRADGTKSFSIYRTANGLLVLVGVPETHAFRLRYAPHDDPAAQALAALLQEGPEVEADA